ncbi:MAG: hypothetical protein MHM6MM_007998, partial [Cercozoa sp. M6MM]
MPRQQTAAEPSTRLFVQNLPKHADERQLREHFSQLGEVTDARVVRKNGVSRRFGFIGYPSIEAATKARKHFNNTFMDTSKLRVSFALPKSDARLERPWSKYSKGSSAHMKLNPEDYKAPAKEAAKQKKGKEGRTHGEKTQEKIASDEKLREFIQVMKPGSAVATWDNDDIALQQQQNTDGATDGATHTNSDDDHIDDDHTNGDRIDHSSDQDQQQGDTWQAQRERHMTDLEFLQSRNKKNGDDLFSDSEDEADDDDSKKNDEEQEWSIVTSPGVREDQAKTKKDDKVVTGRRLFVRNL